MIKILNCSKLPLQEIGINAGICWNADTEDTVKNLKRAWNCIDSGHGRVMEYPDVTLQITGYSARCIRELYTHIIGTTRLQSSTRYVDMSKFMFYEPNMTEKQKIIYESTMETIRVNYINLIENGMSKEDAANILPLGMHTEIVWKVNLRALEHFMNMRLCSRAYKEIRDLANDIKKELSEVSPEWRMICKNLFVPNCEKYLYCSEDKCCGRKIKKSELLKILDEYKEKTDDGK